MALAAMKRKSSSDWGARSVVGKKFSLSEHFENWFLRVNVFCTLSVAGD